MTLISRISNTFITPELIWKLFHEKSALRISFTGNTLKILLLHCSQSFGSYTDQKAPKRTSFPPSLAGMKRAVGFFESFICFLVQSSDLLLFCCLSCRTHPITHLTRTNTAMIRCCNQSVIVFLYPLFPLSAHPPSLPPPPRASHHQSPLFSSCVTPHPHSPLSVRIEFAFCFQ